MLSREGHLEKSLNQPRLILDVAAIALAVLGLFGCRAEAQWAKNLSLSTLLTGVSLLGMNRVAHSLYGQAAMGALEADFKRSNLEAESAEKKAADLQQKIQEWEQFWEAQKAALTSQKAALSRQIQALQQGLAEERHTADTAIAAAFEQEQRAQALEERIAGLQQHVEQLDLLLAAERSAQSQLEATIVENSQAFIQQSISEWGDRLESAIASSLSKLQGQEGAALKKLKQSAQQRAGYFQSLASELSPVGDISETVAAILEMLEQASLEFSALRVRFRNSLNTINSAALQSEIDKLDAELERYESGDLMPRSEHEAALATLKQQHQAILSEFKSEKDGLIQTFLSKAEELEREVGAEDAALIERLGRQLEAALRELESYKQKLSEVLRPQSWHPATRDDFRMGNEIITFFHKEGITLDRAYSDYRKWESLMYFHIDRNERIILPSELNESGDRLQQVIGSLNVPKFEFDSEQGLMRVRVQLHRKPKADASEIHKLWKRADQFPQLVQDWERVRVTGGSEAGKSPTAENLTICILMHRKDRGETFLANPMNDSKKNHWTIPVSWPSHERALDGLTQLKKSIEDRSSGLEAKDKFDFYIFDEIDSTMSQYKQAPGIIKFIIKQASHQNIGCLFVGQNANTKNYPGFDRSDWNNVINIHIGANSFDAITNSNLSSQEQKSLAEKADKLTEFCQDKNEELGLDKKDPNAYRFALVLEPNKKGYFIEVPRFGCYTFDKIESELALTSTLASEQDAGASSQIVQFPKLALVKEFDAASKDASDAASDPYVGAGCPKCETGTLTRTKKNRGSLLYVCSDCGKSTSRSRMEGVLLGHEEGGDEP